MTSTGINKVELLGTLSFDPDLRYIPNGTALCKFGVSVKTPDATTFISCVAWGKLAEDVARYVRKGESIAVQGYLKANSFDSRAGTGRVVKLEVVVKKISFAQGNDKELKAFEAEPRKGKEEKLSADLENIPF